MSARAVTVLAVAFAALACAVALAAPNHTGSIAPGGTYAWDGGPLSGGSATSDVEQEAPCDAPQACDLTLVKAEPGQVTVDIAGQGQGAVDLDMFVFRSDAKGAEGKFVKSSTGSTADEHTTFEAEAGYYLVKVTPATAVNATFKGKVTEVALPPLPPEQTFGQSPSPPGGPDSGAGPTTTTPAAPGTDGGGAQPAPLANDLAPTTVASRPARHRVRVLRGTARDLDGRVAYVDVALARDLGRRCQALAATGRFVAIKKCTAPHFVRARGTTAWSLRLRHALRPGRYVVYARATDNLGRVDAGFGPANARRFTVRR